MTFDQLPSQARSIFLGKEYSPEKDIRLFVDAQFEIIKASHPSRRSLPTSWPLSSDVEAITTKSTGQFIYAATVMRYISHPSTVPSLSLERGKGIVSAVNNSPFAELDSIYLLILDRASDPDATLDMLSMSFLRKDHRSDIQILRCYNSRYSSALIESCVSELSAIIQITEHGNIRRWLIS